MVAHLHGVTSQEGEPATGKSNSAEWPEKGKVGGVMI